MICKTAPDDVVYGQPRHDWLPEAAGMVCDCGETVAWDAFNWWWLLRMRADWRHRGHGDAVIAGRLQTASVLLRAAV